MTVYINEVALIWFGHCNVNPDVVINDDVNDVIGLGNVVTKIDVISPCKLLLFIGATVILYAIPELNPVNGATVEVVVFVCVILPSDDLIVYVYFIAPVIVPHDTWKLVAVSNDIVNVTPVINVETTTEDGWPLPLVEFIGVIVTVYCLPGDKPVKFLLFSWGILIAVVGVKKVDDGET